MSHLALTILEVPIILLCAYANTNTKIICIIFMYQDVCNFFLLLLFINFNDPLLGHKPNEFLQTKTNVNFFNLSLLSLLYMLKSFQNTMELSTLSTFLLHVYILKCVSFGVDGTRQLKTTNAGFINMQRAKRNVFQDLVIKRSITPCITYHHAANRSWKFKEQ